MDSEHLAEPNCKLKRAECDNSDHPIFSRDPSYWVSLIHKNVRVATQDKTEHRGWVYTVDPVSESVVLVDCQECPSPTVPVQIIVGQSIKSIEILDHASPVSDDKVKLFCDGLFRPPAQVSLSKEELACRRKRLLLWLEKHRIPVSDGGVDGLGLSVLSDAVVIEPPFTEESCLSTNEIILSRIQDLVKTMPKQ